MFSGAQISLSDDGCVRSRHPRRDRGARSLSAALQDRDGRPVDPARRPAGRALFGDARPLRRHCGTRRPLRACRDRVARLPRRARRSDLHARRAGDAPVAARRTHRRGAGARRRGARDRPGGRCAVLALSLGRGAAHGRDLRLHRVPEALGHVRSLQEFLHEAARRRRTVFATLAEAFLRLERRRAMSRSI